MTCRSRIRQLNIAIRFSNNENPVQRVADADNTYAVPLEMFNCSWTDDESEVPAKVPVTVSMFFPDSGRAVSVTVLPGGILTAETVTVTGPTVLYGSVTSGDL